MKGWRLIRQTPEMIYYFNCSNGQVEYSPKRKYRIEKRNAFDPSKLYQRDEYREDSFDLQAVLNPDEYYTLMSFITATGNLYKIIEQSSAGQDRDESDVQLLRLSEKSGEFGLFLPEKPFKCPHISSFFRFS